MAPLPPNITQQWPQFLEPCPAGEVAGRCSQPTWDPDPGPFTYEIVADPGGVYEISGADILAKVEIDGAYFVGVTSTSAGGTSAENGATLIFADNQNPDDDTTPYLKDKDDYVGNPLIPPPVAEDAPTDVYWDWYLPRAAVKIVPHARIGVDFGIDKPDRYAQGKLAFWNEALLGPCPEAEIEEEARRMARDNPVPYRSIGETP